MITLAGSNQDILNRDGDSNTICPLLFEGAVDYFKELPLPSDVAGMNLVYKYLTADQKLTPTLLSINVKNTSIRKIRIWKKYFNGRKLLVKSLEQESRI